MDDIVFAPTDGAGGCIEVETLVAVVWYIWVDSRELIQLIFV